MKFKVDHKTFVYWMIESSEDLKLFGDKVRNGLLENGEFTITTQLLLDESAYIPEHILSDEPLDGYEPDDFDNEFELINLPIKNKTHED